MGLPFLSMADENPSIAPRSLSSSLKSAYAVLFYYFGYGRVVLILELIAHFIFQSLKAYSKYSPTIVCCLGSPSKVATWSRPSRSPIAASDL